MLSQAYLGLHDLVAAEKCLQKGGICSDNISNSITEKSLLIKSSFVRRVYYLSGSHRNSCSHTLIPYH